MPTSVPSYAKGIARVFNWTIASSVGHALQGDILTALTLPIVLLAIGLHAAAGWMCIRRHARFESWHRFVVLEIGMTAVGCVLALVEAARPVVMPLKPTRHDGVSVAPWALVVLALLAFAFASLLGRALRMRRRWLQWVGVGLLGASTLSFAGLMFLLVRPSPASYVESTEEVATVPAIGPPPSPWELERGDPSGHRFGLALDSRHRLFVVYNNDWRWPAASLAVVGIGVPDSIYLHSAIRVRHDSKAGLWLFVDADDPKRIQLNREDGMEVAALQPEDIKFELGPPKMFFLVAGIGCLASWAAALCARRRDARRPTPDSHDDASIPKLLAAGLLALFSIAPLTAYSLWILM